MSKLIKKKVLIALWIVFGVLVADVTYRYGFEFLAVPTSSMQSTIAAGNYVWVNKLKPGPRFYFNNIQKYRRIKLGDPLQSNDVIVFNFPDADTAFTKKPGESYYLLKRQDGVTDSTIQSEEWGKLMALKVGQRPRMIKRVVGLPGDTILIRNGVLIVNNQPFKAPSTGLKPYQWNADTALVQELSEVLQRKITIHEINHKWVIHLINHEVSKLEKWKDSFSQMTIRPGVYDPHVFPFTKERRWNSDNMGPIILPQKGATIKISPENIDFYLRILNVFEQNKIKEKGNYLFNNNIPISSYTFKMDYYWVHGDNQPQSFDSRYWGPVPENHIVGVVRP